MPNANDAMQPAGAPRAAAGNGEPVGPDVSRINLKYLGGIAIAGAVGGLLYWVVARFSGTAIPGNFGPAGAILALMFVGAIAAAIGVYLLTASDPAAIRTYIFAVLCGLMWQPVISAGQRIVTDATATSQDSAASQADQDVQSAASGGNVDQINAAVKKSVPAVTQALSTSGSVSDTDKKTEIAETSKRAIATLQTTAQKAPDASVDALSKISLSAANSNQPAVAISAIQSLRTVAEDADRAHNPSVVAKVRQTLLSLAEDAKDPTVKKSATLSAAQLSAPN